MITSLVDENQILPQYVRELKIGNLHLIDDSDSEAYIDTLLAISATRLFMNCLKLIKIQHCLNNIIRLKFYFFISFVNSNKPSEKHWKNSMRKEIRKNFRYYRKFWKRLVL